MSVKASVPRADLSSSPRSSSSQVVPVLSLRPSNASGPLFPPGAGYTPFFDYSPYLD